MEMDRNQAPMEHGFLQERKNASLLEMIVESFLRQDHHYSKPYRL